MALLNNLINTFRFSPPPPPPPPAGGNGSEGAPTTLEQNKLKILIGLLGILLPFILWGGLSAYTYHPANYFPLESISHYYYTRMSTWFVVTLSLLAVVLLLYRGKDPADIWLSSIAGACALLVVLLPTSDLGSKSGVPEYAVTFLGKTGYYDIRTKTHFFSAGVFLLSLALISIFRFPKTDPSPEFRQHPTFYTTVYIGCGIVMILAILGIVMGNYGILLKREWFERETNGIGTFIGESIAVFAFGYSWLLNAGFFNKFVLYVFGNFPPGGPTGAAGRAGPKKPD
ncbi:hypothetical protein [Spirosoma endbachense]|uniref:DUF998 domain-containing protein n=1 Tax=Spirosoma endbachense TaxID=2666025 RepID=A0A6P1VR05_9BACT|nr:hypothetical protein [Spirosoma endbachense]QHV95125.1 hypothetical protein GJR95_08895 [Spirosoma endbachense]